jgi:hypothetical protein
MAADCRYDGVSAYVTFSDAITPADLMNVINYMLDLEGRLHRAPNRLVDFGPTTTVAVGFGDIANLTHIRHMTPQPTRFGRPWSSTVRRNRGSPACSRRLTSVR